MKHIKHIVSSQFNAYVMPVGYWADLGKCKEEAQAFANKNQIETLLALEGDLALQETGNDKNHIIKFLPQK